MEPPCFCFRDVGLWVGVYILLITPTEEVLQNQ
jgi:hypothetical protein